jgi:hypothetical protein
VSGDHDSSATVCLHPFARNEIAQRIDPDFIRQGFDLSQDQRTNDVFVA